MSDLITKIHSCKEEELNKIIDLELEKNIQNSKKQEFLGFGENMSKLTIHNGFINPATKIRYSNGTMNSYSMKTTDYFYEFAKYIKNNKINTKGQIVKTVENFINCYFGINKLEGDFRDNYFDQFTNTTTTDEEYFNVIDSFEIGNLKGKGIAMCTEKAAVAQNLLSLFGFETYFCMGCVSYDNKEEPHCFNIAKAKESYILLDYSMPVSIFKNNIAIDYAPFQGEINNTEIQEFLNGNFDKLYNQYEYIVNEEVRKKIIIPNDERKYIVGSFSFDKSNNKKI